jgi:hypothetical protein
LVGTDTVFVPVVAIISLIINLVLFILAIDCNGSLKTVSLWKSRQLIVLTEVELLVVMVSSTCSLAAREAANWASAAGLPGSGAWVGSSYMFEDSSSCEVDATGRV